MSNTLVMIVIFVGVGVFFYFSAKNAKKNPRNAENQTNEDQENQ